MKFLASQKLIKDGFVMHILVVYGYKKKSWKAAGKETNTQ